MLNKILIAYPFFGEISFVNDLIYLPELVQDESSLRIAIRTHQPTIILVGNNSVGSETLQLWKNLINNCNIDLFIIRRGSSLSRIDLIKAKQLNINVLNTLSVNSKFVAQYMIKHLELKQSTTISILGSGAIGSRIAYCLMMNKHKINISSPSLTYSDDLTRKKLQRKKGIDFDEINVCLSHEQTIPNATHFIIAIDAEKIIEDHQKVSLNFLKSIPNGSRIVSVAEFKIFQDGFFDILIERIAQGQLTAVLDSHSFDLAKITNHPVGLQTVSNAMKEPGCGQAMDQAVFIVLANILIEQLIKSSFELEKYFLNSNDHQQITIVGCGILGLITGLFLSTNGYSIKFLDEHDQPSFEINSNDTSCICRGTTLDGCDARHASITETLPHALFYRKDSLAKSPDDHGGWRIIEEPFNEQEALWIDRFSELAGYPELIVNLINPFISNLNRRGIQLWNYIFNKFPHLTENICIRQRILRICPSSSLLNVVSSFQSNLHKSDEDLQRLTHSQVLEKLPNLKLLDGDAGAVEVPGFSVNHLKLSQNLLKHLQNQSNVTFQWSTQIKSIEQINSSKIIFASSLNKIDSNLFDQIRLSIQGVLGCWIQIPNIHSIEIPFKITEKEPIGVMNITPSHDLQHLFVTGAFAFSAHRYPIKSNYFDRLIELFNEKVRLYLPDEMDAFESDIHTTKICIRPMTPDGMPVIHKLNSNNKQDLFFIGGTNAGGFVQAPVLAHFILDYIQTNKHFNQDLKHIYSPLKLNRNTLLQN